MTAQELFNEIPLWQVAHVVPHEAAQVIAEWLHDEAERRSKTEYTEKEIAEWAARIGNIN
ncbi:hypothetical protein [Neisseria cinerea]|uniref:hypothetical protein n=1 Tax=Neisseria cinerea TaxID=483 RepID=UPI002055E9D8|nr:hypothetical protein [Neisseria cinerea]DAY43348.1 MAG TPA: hypothetical protein [Caudoviricetes sp.]